MRYRREFAVAYANRYWNQANPNFITFSVDCTNFVSQCLYAGGLPMDYTRKRETGWWYKGAWQGSEWWSFSWSVAHSLQHYLFQSQRATSVALASQLEQGDLISYDWNGSGRFQHSAIVTAHGAGHQPLVNAHTYSAYQKYWDYRDSPAWSPQTKYVFIKIHDDHRSSR